MADKDQQLHDAICQGDLETVKILLKQGSNINQTDEQGNAPLHTAIKTKNQSIVECLIQHGADVDQESKNAQTPLNLAASLGRLKAVEFLLVHGADMKKEDGSGMNALNNAVSKGHLDVTKYLIRQGAEVMKGDYMGRTALHFAANFGHLDITKRLIIQGAEVNKADNRGWTALQVSAQTGFLDIAEYLISQGAEVNRGNDEGVTALHSTAEKGHLDVTKYLIRQGAEVNKGNKIGWTALHFAAQNGHLDVTKYLISQGAKMNKGSNDGRTALQGAVSFGHIDVTKYLITQGANLHKRNKEGWTALHFAAQFDHLGVLEYLVSKEAKVNEQTNDGWTALHFVVMVGNLEGTKYLISKGAAVNMGNNDGWTSLYCAAKFGHLHVTKYLISQGAEINKGINDGRTALHCAVHYGHLEITKYLISQGAEVNKGNNDGWNALLFAAKAGHLDVTKYLISQGAEVDRGQNIGITALHIAVQDGHINITKYLISQGAKVNGGSNDGRTALHFAALVGHLDVTKHLISEGARVNGESNDGQTALHFAAMVGHLDVIKYLVSEGAKMNMGNNDGRTALHFAAQAGHLDATKCLISLGAEVDNGSKAGWTALHMAAMFGKLGVTKYLISQGANVNKGSYAGVTALHIAAQAGHLAVTKCLISHGAGVNEVTNEGWTPLHSAAKIGPVIFSDGPFEQGVVMSNRIHDHLNVVSSPSNNSLEVMKCLISAGAEVNKLDCFERTALHDAALYGRLSMTKLLVRLGADMTMGDNRGRTPLHDAVQQGHIGVVEFLFSQGARFDVKDNDSQTPMGLSIILGHESITSLFKVPPKSEKKDLPDIHLAIEAGNTSAIESLVSQGADLNIQSADGQPCLHEAIRLCYEVERNVKETDTLRKISDEFYKGELPPEKALVFYLLDNGAKTDVRDARGNLPIQYAKDEIVKQMVFSRLPTSHWMLSYRDDPSAHIDHRQDALSAGGNLDTSRSVDTSTIDLAPPEILARGPKAYKAYCDATQGGMKAVFRTRLMLVGQERVGKTSLKKSLMGKRFDPHERVTDGVEINIEVARTKGTQWSMHKEDADGYSRALANKMTESLAASYSQGESSSELHSEKTDGNSSHPGTLADGYIKAGPAETMKGIDNGTRDTVTSIPKSEEYDESKVKQEQAGITDQTEVASIEAPSRESQKQGHIPDNIAGLVEIKLREKILMEAEESGRTDGKVSDELSLSIWDFAGHDVYYTTHQVFLTWRAVYILVFDLSRDLDPTVPPEDRGELYTKARRETQSELTCLEFINFWLCSIYAHAVAPPSKNGKNVTETAQKSPKIFIVGTHREDVKGNKTEKWKKIHSAFRKIRNSIEKKHFNDHVVTRYYAIENSLGDKDKELLALRKHIEEVAISEPYMGEKIPIRWLLFEDAVSASKDNYITLDEAKKLVRPVGIESEEELFTMLNFYHDLGTIVYYGDIDDHQSLLGDIVILNPQWLVDVFKTVISIPEFAIKRNEEDVQDDWNNLENRGILTDKLIKHLWHVQKEAMIEIMLKFDLICEAPAHWHKPEKPDKSDDEDKDVKKTYYVPSRMTSDCSKRDIAQIKSSQDFYVDFKGFLPTGLFHRLMARAVKWFGATSGKPATLFCRHISKMTEDHQAVLEMLPPQEATIKIAIFRNDVDKENRDVLDDGEHPDLAVEVMDFVKESLASMKKHWAKRIHYDIYSACPQCGKRKLLKDSLRGMSPYCRKHRMSRDVASNSDPAQSVREYLRGNFEVSMDIGDDTVKEHGCDNAEDGQDGLSETEILDPKAESRTSNMSKLQHTKTSKDDESQRKIENLKTKSTFSDTPSASGVADSHPTLKTDIIEMPSKIVRMDSSGGEIEIDDCGIIMKVPPGAVETQVNITIRPLCNPPQIHMTPDEILASWGFQCSPGGLKFHKPIEVRLSHCAVFSRDDSMEVVLYMSDSDKDGGVYKRIPLGSDCRVEKDFIHFHISHFSTIFETLKSKCSTAVGHVASLIPKTSKKVFVVPFLGAIEPASKYHLKVFICSANQGTLKGITEKQNKLEYRMMEQETKLRVRTNGGDVQINLKTDPAGPVDHQTLQESDILHLNCQPIYFTLNFEEMAESVCVKLSVGQSSRSEKPLQFFIKREVETTRILGATAQTLSSDIEEIELMRLAGKVSPTDYQKVCICIGIPRAAGERVLSKHHMNFEAALIEILCDWNEKTQLDRSNREVLAQKLHDAGLDSFGKALLAGYYKTKPK